MKRSVLLSILIPIGCLILYNIVIFLIFPPETIDITGDKSFVGAKVYAKSNKNVYLHETLIGIMTWDDKRQEAYTRDIRAINGDIIYKLTLKSLYPHDEAFSMPNVTDSLDLKVITVDNKVFIYHAYNGEDLAYNSYPLKNFKQIN